MLNDFIAFYYTESGGTWSQAQFAPGPFAITLRSFFFTTYAPGKILYHQEYGQQDDPFAFSGWTFTESGILRYDLPGNNIFVPEATDLPYEPDTQQRGLSTTNSVPVRGFYTTQSLPDRDIELAAAPVAMTVQADVTAKGGTVAQENARRARSGSDIWYSAMIPEGEYTQEIADNGNQLVTNLGNLGVIGLYTAS